jgi:hypothetical protein
LKRRRSIMARSFPFLREGGSATGVHITGKSQGPSGDVGPITPEQVCSVPMTGNSRTFPERSGVCRPNVRSRSSTEIGACDNEVRFTLELGHRAMLSSQHLFGCAK